MSKKGFRPFDQRRLLVREQIDADLQIGDTSVSYSFLRVRLCNDAHARMTETIGPRDPNGGSTLSPRIEDGEARGVTSDYWETRGDGKQSAERTVARDMSVLRSRDIDCRRPTLSVIQRLVNLHEKRDQLS